MSFYCNKGDCNEYETLLALAVSAVYSVGVAQAHEHNHDHNMAPKGASIEVKVQQLDPVNGNKDVGTVTITESNYVLCLP